MSNKKNTIGFWGTSHAGKTTYLVMLYNVFLSQHEKWEIYANDTKSRNFIDQAFERVFEKNEFPPNTLEIHTYSFTIENKQDKSQSFTLEFLDAPGEVYEQYFIDKRTKEPVEIIARDQSQTTKAEDNTPEALFAKLRDCDRLMMFIDPAWRRKNTPVRAYQTLLRELFEDLREYRRETEQTTPSRIALVMSKVDGDDALWDARNNINRSRCERLGHENIDCEAQCLVYQELGQQFMTVQLPGIANAQSIRCFAISSIGRVDDKSNVGMQDHWKRHETPTPYSFNLDKFKHKGAVQPQYDEFNKERKNIAVLNTLEPSSINSVDKLKPYGLLEPLYWLLELEG